MKIITCLALSMFALTAAYSADGPVFPTDKEAVEHYRKSLQDVSPKTAQKFIDIVGLDMTDKDAVSKMKPIMAVMDLAFETSGALRTVDVMRVLKYGPSVRHAGYLLLYEHNIVVLDVWFFNTPKGWQLVRYNVNVNSDFTDTLSNIPVEFGAPAEGY
jgi:hypothetical protein